MTSDSNKTFAKRWLPSTLSDQGLGEPHKVE